MHKHQTNRLQCVTTRMRRMATCKRFIPCDWSKGKWFGRHTQICLPCNSSRTGHSLARPFHLSGFVCVHLPVIINASVHAIWMALISWKNRFLIFCHFLFAKCVTNCRRIECIWLAKQRRCRFCPCRLLSDIVLDNPFTIAEPSVHFFSSINIFVIRPIVRATY